MLDAEAPLLIAVNEYLRTNLPLTNQQCDIEPDEDVDAIVPASYLSIVPNGFAPGPNHNPNGQIWDIYLGIRLVAWQRIGDVPKDRRRNTFVDLLSSLNVSLMAAVNLIDNSGAFLTAATNKLQETVTNGQFIEPLRLQGIDIKPQLVSFEPYQAEQIKNRQGSDPFFAWKRGANLGKIRYMMNR